MKLLMRTDPASLAKPLLRALLVIPLKMRRGEGADNCTEWINTVRIFLLRGNSYMRGGALYKRLSKMM